jgi:hypothetical protein
MVHLCHRCDAICSDDLNDYGLDEEGNPICEACLAEKEFEKESDDERTN